MYLLGESLKTQQISPGIPLFYRRGIKVVQNYSGRRGIRYAMIELTGLCTRHTTA